MSVVGQWTLFYGWGCSGSYSQAAMTINANGTFAIGSLTGKWVQVEGMVTWQFDNKATYGGNVVGGAMVGLMSTFTGLNGCWYAIKARAMAAKEEKPEYDAAGNKAKM
jgi:hypothetical protein